MTESNSRVDVKNLHDYLGRGVDGRTPPETGLHALDEYSREKFEMCIQKKKTSLKPVSQYKSQFSCRTHEEEYNKCRGKLQCKTTPSHAARRKIDG